MKVLSVPMTGVVFTCTIAAVFADIVSPHIAVVLYVLDVVLWSVGPSVALDFVSINEVLYGAALP